MKSHYSPLHHDGDSKLLIGCVPLPVCGQCHLHRVEREDDLCPGCAQEDELWVVRQIAEKVADQWQSMRRSFPSDAESNRLGDLLDELTEEVRR